MTESLTLIVYALFAAASPVTLIATLVVLGTRDGRVNGMAFAAGFILGQAAGVGIPLLVGAGLFGDTTSAGNTSAWLELAIGLLVLLASVRLHSKRAEPPSGESRAAGLLVRLEGVNRNTAFSIGVPLGIGAKRLLISIIAAQTIALESVSRSVEFRQAALYVVIASVLVWLPVVFYFVVGPNADEWVATAKRWLLGNQRQVTFYLALVFGLFFTVDAVAKLLT